MINVCGGSIFRFMPKLLGNYLVVGCLAAATLGFELVQTRVLSALYYNHVVYLTVTIALMGFGIAGVAVSILSNRIKTTPQLIAVISALFALCMVLSIAAASRLPIWFAYYPILFKLILSYMLLMLPFLCSGTALGLVFMQNGPDIFRYYCFDLVASALACAAFTLLLLPLGAGGFIWLCVGLATIACAIATHKAGGAKWMVMAGPVLVVLGAGLIGKNVINNRPEHYKTLGGYEKIPDFKIEQTKWTPITRLDLFSAPTMHRKIITQDADAHTPLYSPSRVWWEVKTAHDGGMPGGSLGLMYHMRLTPPDQSLVIGVGGGIDIVRSHAYGSKHTTGVEINPATVDLVTKKYAYYVVWPKWEDVNIIVEEGRHYVRSHTNFYDTITMSGIDTFSALNSGAYVLSENYLYTAEAFQDYLSALKPDGMMAINRWFEAVPPRESLRLASLHVEASRRMGIAHPEKNIFVIATMPWATTIIKKTPFTPREVLWALYMTNNTGMKVVYLPKVFPPDQQRVIERILARSRGKALNIASDAYEHLVNPVNEQQKELFLAKYPLDVTPVYDDRPFFFEYHKGTSLLQWLKGLVFVRANVQSNLLVMLVVCVLVSAFAMLGPLMIFNRQGLETHGVGWLLMYFSSLGIGFMLVEIGMMQRLSLYLGDPMHSLLVVLGGLLLYAGFGAYVSGYSGWSHRKLFTWGTLGAGAMIICWLAVVPRVILLTHTYPYFLRVVIVLFFLFPVGVVLGIPFATGLNFIEKITPRFIPWAWGINGLTSVLASILAIVMAMHIGFTAVLALGAIVYGVGWLSIYKYQSMANQR